MKQAMHKREWARACRWLGWGWVLTSAALAWWDLQARWIEPGREAISLLKLWIYWGSWATLPLLAEAALRLRQSPRRPVSRWLWAGLLALVAYSGLLEPRMLVVHTHRIPVRQGAIPMPPLRIALVADMHAGLFVRQWQLERLVDALNAEQVDAVLVAGDWVYEPHHDLRVVLAPLERLRHPVFGVLGNHDTEAPGPALTPALKVALQERGVQLLEGRAVNFRGWELVGVQDLWGGDPRKDIARRLLQPAAVPRLVLAHQPDTVALMPPESAALVVSGHVHGGQIWLPWITENLVLPGMSQYGWYNGLYYPRAGALFVTAGTGQIGLPARLGLVPRVDVLELVQPQ